MGVPKFFRWMSERYPKMNQRFGSLPNEETCKRYFDGKTPPPPLEYPDPLSTCGLPPPVDRLYIDLNGIIHGCSHNNSGDADDDRNDEMADGDALSASSTTVRISREEIYRNVCYYLDRVIGDMIQPTELVYLAIDGVAPRAKLNQQRSRRYRSGTEGEIELNIYEAHAKKMAEEKRSDHDNDDDDDVSLVEGTLIFGGRDSKSSSSSSPMAMDDGFSYLYNDSYTARGKSSSSHPSSSSSLDASQSTTTTSTGTNRDDVVKEVEPGRFKGKFETKVAASATAGSDKRGGISEGLKDATDEVEEFHSNVITPGTPFFQEFTTHLEHFLKYKISTDPKWQHLTIILSGPNVPGEGEHKLMDFIRSEKARPNYNPNLRHCIVGQDGDLIMLGLATHEPNLVLFRERVVFSMAKRRLALSQHSGESLDTYLHNCHFEFLHLGVLRDYLAFEFETSNILSSSPYDLERTIDDFVFMTFFVGNDFLPHMPALDIADHAFDLLFYTYKQCRRRWLKNGIEEPYLTNAGQIVSGRRLEEFLSAVGGHEVDYYDKKKMTWAGEQKRLKASYKRWGMDGNIPHADLVASKEESDRAAYRKMLLQGKLDAEALSNVNDESSNNKGFSPVMTGDFQPLEEEDELEEGLIARMGNLLQNSLSNGDDADSAAVRWNAVGLDDQDLKGRYYYDKFQFTPFDQEKHVALRKAYVEGLVWCLKYYYEGCVSWEWYFPYHYGPMLSDLVNLDEILDEVNFDDKLGRPLKPFEQLLGCMPPSQAKHLPEPYQWLMTDPKSPIIDFYPKSFTIDMNGKRWPWEAVVLLPFIDSQRLLEAVASVNVESLSEEEKARNSIGEAFVLQYDPNHSEMLEGVGSTEGFQTIEESKAKMTPLSTSEKNFTPAVKPVLRPELMDGVQIPLPGFGSLRDAPVKSLWRRNLGIDVFSSRSRYRTACLEMYNMMPPLPPIEDLAPKLIGTSVFINYPYSLEGLVTAVSDEKCTLRGTHDARPWTSREAEVWRARRDGATRQFLTGEGLTGTGGLVIPEGQPITLSVRPFEKMVTTKSGQVVKSYAKFEVEVPLIATFWNPRSPDPRLNVPSRLEKNAFDIAAFQLRDGVPLDPRTAAKKTSAPRRRLFPPRKEAKNMINGSGVRSYSTIAQPRMNSLPTSSGTFLLDSNITTIRQKRTMHRPALATPPTRSVRHLTSGSTKSKLVTAGILAAGFLFGSANAIAIPFCNIPATRSTHGTTMNMEHFRMESKISSSSLLDVRGGDTEESTQTEMAAATPPLDFAHGTTTLSFIFQGGIVAAVDSRASLGSFVGSKTTQKVLPVNSHILGTMAGGAADCMYWIRHVKSKALLHELVEGSRMSVARASQILSHALFEQRGRDLSVGTMIMGYDDESNSPHIYYVDNTGKRIKGNMFAVGSGSTFALGILDTELRYDMTQDEAIALGIKAIRHATFRDSYSGGYINVYFITKDGWKRVYTDDIAARE